MAPSSKRGPARTATGPRTIHPAPARMAPAQAAGLDRGGVAPYAALSLQPAKTDVDRALLRLVEGSGRAAANPISRKGPSRLELRFRRRRLQPAPHDQTRTYHLT